MNRANRRLGGSRFPTHDSIPPKINNSKNCDRDTLSTDCDTAVNSNQGCGVGFSDPYPPYKSYGAPFNHAGGGYFVTYKGRDFVKVWFYPRLGYVPEVIRDGAQRGKLVDPDFSWGFPAANFPFYPGHCDYEQHFNAHQMVFDLTFCVGVLSTRLVFCSIHG